MKLSYLTKEEEKAIKKGYAYSSWRSRNLLVGILFMTWVFGGIALAHINDVTKVIYIIGLILVLIAEFWVFVLTCWKCPKCKTKLPARSVIGGPTSALLPMPVMCCPHCRFDLTKRKADIERSSKEV